MEIIITEDYTEMSKQARRYRRKAAPEKNPIACWGWPPARPPSGSTRSSFAGHKEEGLDFSKVITFNLDEYLDLSPSHDQSYRYFMDENLFKHINIDPKNIHVPYGHADNVEDFCQWYEDEIVRAGGIDLQILGIGGDGHIAFNEPGLFPGVAKLASKP